MRKGLNGLRVYDVPAEGYEELYGVEQEQKYEDAFRNIDLIDEWRVLDVGCGILLLLRYLRSRGFNGYYVGLDIDEERLRYSKKYRDGMSDVVEADAHNLPFRPQAFHLTTLITVIHLLRPESLEAIHEKTRLMLITTLLRKRADLRKRVEKILRKLGRTFSIDSTGKDEIYITIRTNRDNMIRVKFGSPAH